MKKKQLFVATLVALGLILTSCGKNASESSIAATTDTAKIEISPEANHTTKPLNLGLANSFAVMAYTSIISAPTSTITGKVGLKPGTRSLISLNPTTEVSGGEGEVYAGDDVGESQNLITRARLDLISAYRDAVSRSADRDKIEAYGGNLGGKILPAGVYHWSKGVNILSDVTLEGNDTDVWIFQIAGNLNIAKDVRMILSGGTQPKNIFWQISGRATLENNSAVSGTLISQLTFEMKTNAQITGRAMVKNGKLIMSQNIITKP